MSQLTRYDDLKMAREVESMRNPSRRALREFAVIEIVTLFVSLIW